MSKTGLTTAAIMVGIGWKIGSFIGKVIVTTGGVMLQRGLEKIEDKLQDIVDSNKKEEV